MAYIDFNQKDALKGTALQNVLIERSKIMMILPPIHTQLTFTCSMPTTETIEKHEKYVQQKHQNDVNGVVLMFLLLTLKIF